MDTQIDENLRRAYAESLNQPLPDRFTQLLDQLREQTDQKSDETAEDQD